MSFYLFFIFSKGLAWTCSIFHMGWTNHNIKTQRFADDASNMNDVQRVSVFCNAYPRPLGQPKLHQCPWSYWPCRCRYQRQTGGRDWLASCLTPVGWTWAAGPSHWPRHVHLQGRVEVIDGMVWDGGEKKGEQGEKEIKLSEKCQGKQTGGRAAEQK